MIIAQISDLHLRVDGELLRGRIDSQAALEAVIAHVNGLDPQPDVVLATGDLAQKGPGQDYGALRAYLDRIRAPVYVIPGNHDKRDALRDAFADKGYLPATGKFLHYTVEDFPLRLIGLDTTMARNDGGKMSPKRLAWLEDRLAEQPDRPTLIFMHHPPFKVGVRYMDTPAFKGAADLEALVRRFPNVRRVICGHLHRHVTVGWGGTVASVAPSAVFQMVLDFDPQARSAYRLEPSAVPVFLWREDTGLVGHTSLLGDYGPAHPFHPVAAAADKVA
ncbi:MAG: phosphodiesterase [Rhodobacterales bacterium]|nr:phosphodiesterase [Rhodobacterales bacterium]